MSTDLYARLVAALDYALLSSARYRDPHRNAALLALRDDLAANFPTEHAQTAAQRPVSADPQ